MLFNTPTVLVSEVTLRRDRLHAPMSHPRRDSNRAGYVIIAAHVLSIVY